MKIKPEALAALTDEAPASEGQESTPVQEETQSSEAKEESAPQEEQSAQEEGAKEGEEASPTEGEEASDPKAEEVSADSPESPQETPEDKRFARRFAALSKRDKDLRDRSKDLEQREQMLKQHEELLQVARDAQNLAQTDPMSIVKQLNVDPAKFYNSLTQQFLNEGQPTAGQQNSAVEQKLAALEQKLLESEKVAKEQQLAATVSSYKSELSDFIKEPSNEFELLQLRNDASDLVFDVMDAHYQQTGELLDKAEACKEVEDYLFEEAKTFTKSKKLAALFGEKPEAKPDGKVEPQKSKENPKTLTNKDASEVPNQGDRQESREERIARIAGETFSI